MDSTWHWESRVRRACEREQESGKQCKAILQERVGKLSVPGIQRLDVGQLLEAKPIKIVLCGLVDAKTVSGCSVTSTQASRSAPTPMLHARCRKAPRRRWAVSWRRSCEKHRASKRIPRISSPMLFTHSAVWVKPDVSRKTPGLHKKLRRNGTLLWGNGLDRIGAVGQHMLHLTPTQEHR